MADQKCYMVILANLTDREKFMAGYAAVVAPMIERYGGRYVLRGRGVEQRPFTRVAQLRADANARFRQQEQLLNKRLEETQKKLTDLLSRSQDGEITLSEEDQQGIEDFRTEMFTVRKRLREVQRNLRADIDALGTRVKVAITATERLG